MKINIEKAEKQRLISKTQDFFGNERDEELGIIAAESILDFFVEELSTMFYNKGLDDSRDWIKNRLEELDMDYSSLYK